MHFQCIVVQYLYKGLATSKNAFHYFSLGLHHYSNGQSGAHYAPVTGAINDSLPIISKDPFTASMKTMSMLSGRTGIS
jgi:hypothetical protein